MLEFQFWVERAVQAHAESRDAVPSLVFALHQLAAERAATRLRLAEEAHGFWTDIVRQPDPASYSHWGMHA